MVWGAFLLNPHDYDKAKPRGDFPGVSSVPFRGRKSTMQSTRKTGPTLFPRAQKAGSKAAPALSQISFKYLCKAGKNWQSGFASETLVRYGQRNVHILPLRGRLDARDLTDQDATFLITLQFTEANKRALKTLVENVQRQALLR